MNASLNAPTSEQKKTNFWGGRKHGYEPCGGSSVQRRLQLSCRPVLPMLGGLAMDLRDPPVSLAITTNETCYFAPAIAA